MDERTVHRLRDALNNARNQQQKLVLLGFANGQKVNTRSGAALRSTEELLTDFLQTEIELGLTFAAIAMSAEHGSQKRARNIRNTRKAYDTVVNWNKRLQVTDAASAEANAKLRELENVLQQLGK